MKSYKKWLRSMMSKWAAKIKISILKSMNSGMKCSTKASSKKTSSNKPWKRWNRALDNRLKQMNKIARCLMRAHCLRRRKLRSHLREKCCQRVCQRLTNSVCTLRRRTRLEMRSIIMWFLKDLIRWSKITITTWTSHDSS